MIFRILVYRQALDVVRQSKVAEVLGSEYAKDNNKDFRRRSNSRERVRRDSSDNVSYDRNIGEGDEVSIDKHWSGFASFLVSIHTAQPNVEPFQYFASHSTLHFSAIFNPRTSDKIYCKLIQLLS